MPIIEGTWVVKPSGVDEGYQRSTGAAAKEVGRQLIGGAVVDLPRMAGQGLRWVSNPGSASDNAGRAITDAADRRADDYEPRDTGAGVVGKTLSMGARAVAPMIPAIGAAMLPGVGVYAGPAMAGLAFGTSSAQDTKDKLMLQGVGDKESTQAGYFSGAIQGPAEALGMHVGAAAFRAGKLALGANPTMDGVVGALTSRSAFKPAAKGIGTAMVVEPATEVAQDLGTEMVERSYGAKPEDMLSMAKNSAQAAIGLTALLGPLAAGAQIKHARQRRALADALDNPAAPEESRSMAESIVAREAVTAGVPTDQVDAWKMQRAAARDSAVVVPPTTTSLLTEGAPLPVPAPAVAAEAAPPVEAALPVTAPTAPEVLPAAAEAPPNAGVDPAVLAQRDQEAQAQSDQAAAAQEQQSRVDTIKAKIVADQAARADAENQLGGPEVDDKGKRVNKVPGRYTDTFLELKSLADEGKVDEPAFEDSKTRLIAALQTQDNKTLNTVRKELDAVRNPEPVVEEKPAAEPKPVAAPAPAPAPAAPAVAKIAPIEAKKATPEPGVKESLTPAPAPAAAEAPAPDAKVVLPELDVAPSSAYDQYAGKSVTIQVPQENGKPHLRRTIKDAKAALEEADSRATSFEELVKCISR